MAEIVIHIVKIAMSRIDEPILIPFLFKYPSDIEHTVVIGSFYDTSARCGRHTHRHSLHPPYRTGTGRKKVVKKERPLGKRIHMRRKMLRVPVDTHIGGTHTLYHHQHHIVVFLFSIIFYDTQCIVQIIRDKTAVFAADKFSVTLEYLYNQLRDIELIIIQRIVSKCAKEGVEPIFGKLLVITVFGYLQGNILLLHQVESEQRYRQESECHAKSLSITAMILKYLLKTVRLLIQQPKNTRCEQKNDTQQQRHRIRLLDIADHLMGIDQIIHCDKVETLAKLIPEKPLTKAVEYNSVEYSKEDTQSNDLVQLRVKNPVWHQKEIDHKRDNIVEKSDHIIE